MSVICKSFLSAVMLMEIVFCSISDVRKGIIPNHAIILGLIGALAGEIAYFTFNGSGRLGMFAVWIVLSAMFSLVLYSLRIWAGGDAKLYILLSLLIPAEYLQKNAAVSTAWVFVLIFSIAFVYLIGETIVLLAYREQRYRMSLTDFSIRTVFAYMVAVTTFQVIMQLVFRNWYAENQAAFLLLNVLFVLSLGKIPYAKCKTAVILCTIVSICAVVHSGLQVDWKLMGASLLVLAFRIFAEQYNYQEIQTLDVKPGMILSYATVMKFANSRVKGLPKSTTEDLASRLTTEETDSVIRWADSRYGQPTIMILRKIPFASFISMGFLIYFILGVVVW